MAALLLVGCDKAPEPTSTAHGRFKDVQVFHKQGNDDPLVMLVYDPARESALANGFVRQMLQRGTDVVTITTDEILRDFPNDITRCGNISGDFDNLARFLEAYLQYTSFKMPIVASTPASHELATRVLPKLSDKAFLGRFVLTMQAGAMPDMAQPAACPPRTDVNDAAPLFVLSYRDNTPMLNEVNAAFEQLYKRLPAEQKLDSSVSDLPLTELPTEMEGDMLAILISGDGGWAGFDKKLAEELQLRGFSVVGWDSLRYFWQEQKPEKIAADIDKVVNFYMKQWNKKRLYLLGFSQGADVLPFAEPFLSESTKAVLHKVALISPGKFAQFEFHLGAWVGANTEGAELEPALRAYKGVTMLCLYGSTDKNSGCPPLEGTQIEVHRFEGGHHLNKEVDDIVSLLL